MRRTSSTAWSVEPFPKAYRVHLSQSGTDAPTVAADRGQENTTGLTFTHTRVSDGRFRVTASSTVPFQNTTKVFIKLTPICAPFGDLVSGFAMVNPQSFSNTAFDYFTVDLLDGATATDGILSGNLLEILIYP